MEGAVRLGRDHAFAQAAEPLAFFTGVHLAPTTIRRLTEAAGATVQQLELAFSEALWAGEVRLPETPSAIPPQVSLDGSLIHLRDDGWREVKLVTIGERTPDGLVAQSHAATLGEVDRFEHEMVGEIMRRQVSTTADVVSVNDGADWIQRVLDLHCPQAARVLDFFHAAEYLSKAAPGAYPDDTAARSRWFARWRQELLTGEPGLVLAALADLPPSEARDTALGYLTRRWEQLQYATFRAQGWPIGSGCVESAHGHVVQARLKGRGMRWDREGAAAVLALRVTARSGRWETAWSEAMRHQTAERYRPRPRDGVETPPPSAPLPPAGDASIPADPPPRLHREPMVVDGRPTAHYPWKQFPVVPASPAHHRT